MKYYIYIIDLDIMDKIKELENNDEQIALMLKTNGQCVLEYTKEEYDNIMQEIGVENANILSKMFLSLSDVKLLYESVKMSEKNGYIREFKLKIYPAISECMGIVISKYEEPILKQDKKWFEFWKK